MTFQQILIVRHGETDYNVSHRWQGHLDIPLNPVGRNQAKALSKHLSATQIDKIYSSDLVRASETARIIAQPQRLTLIEDARLRELNQGVFQGLTKEQQQEQYPTIVDRWRADDSFAIPGGESREQARLRAFAVWQDIIRDNSGNTALIVSHGGTISQLLPLIIDSALTKGRRYPNASLTTLHLVNGSWQALGVSETPHLNMNDL